jgi:hypothetical protein
VYIALTAWFGRAVVGSASSSSAYDAGDPLLNATILLWNAVHWPFTQQWWNLPIFYPTANALTYSEHLLGLTPISTLLYWLSGSALTTYNFTLLLMFPLCGAAMYLLTHHLTGRPAASFVAGLAFAFAPYRMGHLAHIQILGAFWMPLALWGLHAYLKTGAPRWLSLFGVGWVLQGAANGYYLVFFSVVVALWIGWFVIIGRRWTALLGSSLTIILFVLPLVPVLHRYIAEHGRYDLVRGLAEIRFFSADVASVLCAPPALTFWGWLRVACKPEGELFPGITIPALCLAAAIVNWRTGTQHPVRTARSIRIFQCVAFVLSVTYLGVAASVSNGGAWRIQFGPLSASASASSFNKPLTVAVLGLISLVMLSSGFRRAAATSSPTCFYAVGLFMAWLFALGPFPSLLDRHVLYRSPYLWLMELPGVDGLRAPARFWMMAVLCAATLTGLVVARLLASAGKLTSVLVVATATVGILIDGWVRQIPVHPAPEIVWRTLLAGSTVVELPLGDLFGDVEAGFRAAEGGWRTVNGYSGYEPPYYQALRIASATEDLSIIENFQNQGPVHVMVRKEAPQLLNAVARYSDVAPIADTSGWKLFRLPQRSISGVERLGERLFVLTVTASCGAEAARLVLDNSLASRWQCGAQTHNQELSLDLGQLKSVSAIANVMGPYSSDLPRNLIVQTSEDLRTWDDAWSGGVLRESFRAAVTEPKVMRVVLPFKARTARHVRLRQVGRDPNRAWSVAEIEVYGGHASR